MWADDPMVRAPTILNTVRMCCRRHLYLAFALIVGGIACAERTGPAFPLHEGPVSEHTLIELAQPVRFFLSGHSLTDEPMPEFVAATARGFGHPFVAYNRQMLPASRLQMRTAGDGDWAGYRAGINREGQGMDVVAELRAPQTIGADNRYDALIVTEGIDIVSDVLHADAVRYLRHIHERSIEGNPSAQTWYYNSWLWMDPNAPERWIQYVKEALPIWGCVAERVNLSLEREGRADRIQVLPAGAALGSLLERVLDPGLPGFTGTELERVHLLFRAGDDLHLTRLGAYYVSLIVYGSITGRSPAGAVIPEDMVNGGPESLARARAVQDHAAAFMHEQALTPRPDLADCRAQLVDSFCARYAAQRGEEEDITCRPTFARTDTTNPLFFDAKLPDISWFPAP
jgi:hypothetical protein